MAKKTLNEAVVRRFQKLANVGSINEMNQNEYYMNEEEEEEEEEEGAEELAAADAPADDMDMGDADMDMDAELQLTEEEAQSIIDLGVKLEAAMGGDPEGETEMGDDMDAEDDMDADPDADAMSPEEEIMEALRGISYKPSKSEVVNEVAKRVAKRLKTAKLHEAKLNRALGRK